jgi:transcriptional regulator with XRE-family HTH domain
MGRKVIVSGSSFLAEVRAQLGISQADMGRLLGIGAVRVAQAEIGSRPLPLIAWPRLRALEAALRAAPEPLPMPDRRPLELRHLQCMAQAQRLAVRLTYELPAQTAVTPYPPRRRRRAARCPHGRPGRRPAAASPPRRPAGPARHAAQRRLNAWEDDCGPTPTALLRARLAGLQAEAAALAQALADDAGAPAAGPNQIPPLTADMPK